MSGDRWRGPWSNDPALGGLGGLCPGRGSRVFLEEDPFTSIAGHPAVREARRADSEGRGAWQLTLIRKCRHTQRTSIPPSKAATSLVRGLSTFALEAFRWNIPPGGIGSTSGNRK